MIARYLEEHGIPTVLVANARDIVEHCGVARLVYTDFPLGNPCGVPYDDEMQREIVSMALDLLVSAKGPRTTIEAPYDWPGGEAWKSKIFTKEQPFLNEEATERWLRDKDEYRKLKDEGKV
ncbi:MAG: hypothetical protein QF893_10795 [Alphaproteobacteria bacterium]|nr:hypothetical protein [Alphaproteobacteria bacterium]